MQKRINNQTETGVNLELTNTFCKTTIKKEVKNLKEIAKESSYKEKLKYNHVLDIKLKNESVPRRQKAFITNAKASKEIKNSFNKFSKGSIPKNFRSDNKNLPISFLSTVENYANKTNILNKAVNFFSKK